MRKIAIITGSRGEYGYIRPIIKLIEKSSKLEYEIIATNMHLLPEFGDSLGAFRQDNFEVKYTPLMTLSGYTPASMTKSLCIFGLSLSDILPASQPDLVLLAGDRGEQLMAATIAAHMNIPVAHIQAGEISGNIDGLSRHAIARFTHIHFAANTDAEERLLKSGEQSFRVFNVGAPQLDEFVSGQVTSENELRAKYELADKFLLMVQHSVTEQQSMAFDQTLATIKAVERTEIQTVAISPNSDAGSSMVTAALDEFRPKNMKIFKNVPREDYAGLMKFSSCLVGNSSSALLEAPTFGLPCVNIGRRQTGRVQGINVLNCGHNSDEIYSTIQQALSPSFKSKITGMLNPYGDGRSSERIVQILSEIALDDRLLQKELTY